MCDDDEEEEEKELTKRKKLVRKKRDKERDNLWHLRKDLEDQEKEAKIAKVTLETQKSLFPP